MIYQPRNVQPSNRSIDVTESNNLSMEISTNTAVQYYQYTIFDFNNNQIYQSPELAILPPRYNGDTLKIPLGATIDDTPESIGLINGKDYKWKVRLTQIYKEPTIRLTYGKMTKDAVVHSEESGDEVIVTSADYYVQPNVNIQVGMYIGLADDSRNSGGIALITAYDNEQGMVTTDTVLDEGSKGTNYVILTDYIDTTPDFILRCRKKPELTIKDMPTTITKKYHAFEGVYSQENNVPMIYYTWKLYLLNADGTKDLVYTNGKTYSADIFMYYEGFKTGQSYQIEFEVETELGVVANSGTHTFQVEYDTLNYFEQPIVSQKKQINALQVDWMTPISIKPQNAIYNIASGYVRDDVNTATQFYIDSGLIIYPGYEITLNNGDSAVIESYNAYTGLVTVATPLGIIPDSGDTYRISKFLSEGLGDIQIILNTPYSKANSAIMGNNTLSYVADSETGILGRVPDKYRISMQFLPDNNFFYAAGTYNSIERLAEIDSNDEHDDIKVIVNKYKIAAIQPNRTTEGAVIYNTIVGTDNTPTYVYLENNIDYTKQKYIYFAKHSYIEEISSYDDTSKKITFTNNLPFEPEENDQVIILNTLETQYYNAINNHFVLQEDAIKNQKYDYIWLDDKVWDDKLYWVEGGTETERFAANWWKVQITNDAIEVQKGGV